MSFFDDIMGKSAALDSGVVYVPEGREAGCLDSEMSAAPGSPAAMSCAQKISLLRQKKALREVAMPAIAIAAGLGLWWWSSRK